MGALSVTTWCVVLSVASVVVAVASRREPPDSRRTHEDGRTLIEALEDLAYRLASEGRYAKASHVRDTIAIVQAVEARTMERSEAR